MGCLHKLVADVTVLAVGQTALVKYADPAKYDGEAGWFVPDDFLRRLEDPNDAARRIVGEQLGLVADRVDLSHVESFEGNGFWHLVFHFRADLASLAELAPGREVATAEWFPLDALPPPDDVAHEGWGLDTIETILGRSAGH